MPEEEKTSWDVRSPRKCYQACVSLSESTTLRKHSPICLRDFDCPNNHDSYLCMSGGGVRGGGGVHAFHPISSLGMRQQLWRHPEDQAEKKKCYWYSLCSWSSAPVMSFWMKAVLSLITLLCICSQNDFSWSTTLITSLNAQKYFMALTVQSSRGQPDPPSVSVTKILLELLCTSIYVVSTAAFMLQCQSGRFWQRAYDLQNLKYLPSGPLPKEFPTSWSRERCPDFYTWQLRSLSIWTQLILVLFISSPLQVPHVPVEKASPTSRVFSCFWTFYWRYYMHIANILSV